jgi:hypothetical protein
VPADGVFPGWGHGAMWVPERPLRQLQDMLLKGPEEESRVATAANEGLSRVPLAR